MSLRLIGGGCTSVNFQASFMHTELKLKAKQEDCGSVLLVHAHGVEYV